MKLKGLVYKSINLCFTQFTLSHAVVNPGLVQTRTQHHLHTIQVAKIRTFRWICGVARLNKISKLWERRLRWYGHGRRPMEMLRYLNKNNEEDPILGGLI